MRTAGRGARPGSCWRPADLSIEGSFNRREEDLSEAGPPNNRKYIGRMCLPVLQEVLRHFFESFPRQRGRRPRLCDFLRDPKHVVHLLFEVRGLVLEGRLPAGLLLGEAREDALEALPRPRLDAALCFDGV